MSFVKIGSVTVILLLSTQSNLYPHFPKFFTDFSEIRYRGFLRNAVEKL